MDFLNDIDVHDCPVCGEAGLLEEEAGWGYSVTCLDCGAYTATIPFKNDEEREMAARKAAELWNYGKVLRSEAGE